MYSLKCNMLKLITEKLKVKSVFMLSKEGLEQFVLERRKMKVLLPSRKMYQEFSITKKSVLGNDCYKVCPKANRTKKKVLFIHGGGYCMEADSREWGMLYSIVRETNATVYMPRYPLSPENDCRKAFEMLMNIYRNLIRTTDSENITILGDSAGGGIALSLAMMIRENKLPQPKNLILISPSLELASTCKGYEDYIEYLEKKDVMISLKGFDYLCDWWRGDLDKKDYRVSPRYGDFTDLAPITVFASKTEVLHVYVKLFLEDAKKQGVSVEYHGKRDMIHCWVLSPIKEAYEERERIMELIRGW